MRAFQLFTFLCLACLAAVGCASRNADMYRTDTRALLEQKRSDVTSCYDDELKKDSAASGKVIIHFSVEADSGKLKNIMVDPKSTASEALSQCVVKAIDGLSLNPPDKKTGNATFTWQFDSKT